MKDDLKIFIDRRKNALDIMKEKQLGIKQVYSRLNFKVGTKSGIKNVPKLFRYQN